MQGLFGTVLGLKVIEARKDKVVAEFDWRPDLCTVGGTLHGGALMAVADQVGATAAFLNLPAGAGTTTLESKTNFFAGCKAGKVRAEATPLHVGGRTSVWQTRLYDEAGKLLSQTLQTQLVLLPK
ncbi:PaaI family thioesterase [Reyranella sp. CPCC 100927]|uniref:PaaI family thioesterase n=1 Tax=Reyranella sp. CPCC 100927 TaxID=2599616 RepID=UPI0011B6D17A|nr:PaaI family thioesterase [Reyranella sp. CPCC 100927]